MSLVKKPAWAIHVARVPALLAIGAGIFLVALVVVVSCGVFLRYVVGAPLLGVNEIVQMVAVALAMLALPYCTSSGAHIRVDLFDNSLGRIGRFIGDLMSRVLSITALWFLCLRAWSKAAEAIEFGDVTNMIKLPLWPVYGAICVGMGLCALVLAAEIVALVLGWRSENV